ncbi:MAG: Mov34/MPN/PAD-1 family protein [Anaerolineaceae bacterium]
MNPTNNWVAKNGEYHLEITTNAHNALERECSKNENLETGGILIGYYSDDHATAIITEITTPPSDSSAGHTWFHRGIHGLQSILLNRWQHTSTRTYYIGEWHYHPALQVIPSNEDNNQMKDISRSQNYQCKKPIMLIAGRRLMGSRQVRIFIFPIGEDCYEYFPIFFDTE